MQAHKHAHWADKFCVVIDAKLHSRPSSGNVDPCKDVLPNLDCLNKQGSSVKHAQGLPVSFLLTLVMSVATGPG